MAKLTEEYHLVDKGNGLELTIQDLTITVKDFSDIRNIRLLPHYDRFKQKLVTIFFTVHKLLEKGIESSKDRELVDQGIDLALMHIASIFSNMFTEESWDNSNIDFTTHFQFKSLQQMIDTLKDLLIIIDIGVYSGLKKLYSIPVHDRIKGLIKEAIVIGPDGEVVDDPELANELVQMVFSIIDKKDKKETKTEDKYDDIDLNDIEPIGNA